MCVRCKVKRRKNKFVIRVFSEDLFTLKRNLFLVIVNAFGSPISSGHKEFSLSPPLPCFTLLLSVSHLKITVLSVFTLSFYAMTAQHVSSPLMAF